VEERPDDLLLLFRFRLTRPPAALVSIIAYNSITGLVARDEVRIVVRRSLAEIERDIRSTLSIRGALLDVSIEKDAVVFAFAPSRPAVDSEPGSAAIASVVTSKPGDAVGTEQQLRRRRKRRVRHRTKTRGWPIVAKFTNSRGQSCAIYKPMFDALTEETLPRRQALAVVREILESNGNKPSPSSIEYYLDNTLEFIEKSRKSPASGA
jgi:hypothetical protein